MVPRQSLKLMERETQGPRTAVRLLWRKGPGNHADPRIARGCALLRRLKPNNLAGFGTAPLAAGPSKRAACQKWIIADASVMAVRRPGHPGQWPEGLQGPQPLGL